MTDIATTDIYISREISIEHHSVGLASLAQLYNFLSFCLFNFSPHSILWELGSYYFICGDDGCGHFSCHHSVPSKISYLRTVLQKIKFFLIVFIILMHFSLKLLIFMSQTLHLSKNISRIILCIKFWIHFFFCM